MSQCIWYGEEKNLIKSEMQMLALFMVLYKTIMMFKLQPSSVSCRKCRSYKESCKRCMSQDSWIDHFSAAIEDCYRYWTFVKLKNFVAEVFANTWHVLHCSTCLSLQFVYNSIIGFISSCIEIACGWCQKSLQPYSNHRIPIYFLWTKTNPSDTLENCNFLLGGDVKMLATLFQP